MKKNFIYTMAFLLCGVLSFSSCEDMLNVESDRVEYEFDDWTFNDSVYSVLGILKSVQKVGDRQVLLNELRADLVSPNYEKAVVDIQQLCEHIYKPETNKYLDVKDYYAIINNCNIYLARVDTALEKNNIKLMMNEYVAVKSIRAWTYLQLAINHGNVPYFTEPVLTHSEAEEVMRKPALSREQLMTKLINDIMPYENPAAFPMPNWHKDGPNGKVITFGYSENANEIAVLTRKLFVPIRMLLGELYLWRGAAGDYKKAAECFYNQITGAGTNETAPKYADRAFYLNYAVKGGKSISDKYSQRFSYQDFDKNSDNSVLTLIPYTYSNLRGETSSLADIFCHPSDIGAAQVTVSPAMLSLSRRQVFRYYQGEDPEKPELVEYSTNYEYPGDLRIKATSFSQQGGKDDGETMYPNIIAKFNMENHSWGAINSIHRGAPNVVTGCITLLRPEHAYLRLAEALVGMARQGYDGAMELAMEILKVGVKDNYSVIKNPVFAERHKINAKGDTIKKFEIDKVTKDTLGFTYVMETYLASYDDSLGYDFTAKAFENNKGIHSRGSGDSERNIYYALNDTCIARYIGKLEKQGDIEVFTGTITKEDSLNYVADLVIDELALEFSWEGTRFGDLMRFARAMGDNEVIAKRIAGRDHVNEVSYRHPEYAMEPALYNKFMDESNWYLPLPDDIVEPTDPDKLPTEGLTSEKK